MVVVERDLLAAAAATRESEVRRAPQPPPVQVYFGAASLTRPSMR